MLMVIIDLECIFPKSTRYLLNGMPTLHAPFLSFLTKLNKRATIGRSIFMLINLGYAPSALDSLSVFLGFFFKTTSLIWVNFVIEVSNNKTHSEK